MSPDQYRKYLHDQYLSGGARRRNAVRERLNSARGRAAAGPTNAGAARK
jgi:hypothetical protein